MKEAKPKKKRPIDLSIDKWEGIALKGGVDMGTANCALCAAHRADDCEECPVMEDTGYSGCETTPYEEWCQHQDDEHNNWGGDKKVECDVCKRIALEELVFLMKVREDYC